MKRFAAVSLYVVVTGSMLYLGMFTVAALFGPQADATYTTTTQAPHLQDHLSGAGVMITVPHHQLHQGKRFSTHYESEAPLPTNAGEETAIGFVTPAAASGRVHMIIDVRADDESVWELREDPTIVLDQGSNLVARNRFRDSANKSGLVNNDTAPSSELTSYTVAEAAAADLSGGIILEHETLAIAGGPPFAGVANAEARGEREWILKAETEYVIIITSSTVNNTVHEISLNWYESGPLVY